MGLWAKSLLIFHAIRAHGKQSIRYLAEHTGRSQSSVYRHLQAINRRNRSPESSLQHGQGVRSAWRQRLSNLSRILHPWRLVDSRRQTPQEVERQLHAELQALETLLATNGLPVKQGTLDKVRTQLAGVSALIDVWWQTMWHDVEHLAMTPRWTQGVEAVLLPLMDWQEQLSRTRCLNQQAQITRALQTIQMETRRV